MPRKRNSALLASAAIALIVGATPISAAAETQYSSVQHVAYEQSAVVHHRTIEIDGLEIAYREAGDPDRPTVLLLHGFPTSSHMYRGLIPMLATRYHVLAPDYPGYGASEMPAREDFEYGFAAFADLIQQFVEAKEVSSYSLYLMDYGAPVGFRLFAKAPERVDSFIIQNGNAYEEGLEGFWDPIKAYWTDRSSANRDALRGLLTLEATRWQYTHGVPNPDLVSPDNWHHDQYLLDREGNNEIQLDMFYDYGSNVALYSDWQALFSEHQPPTLIIWGANDEIFPEVGAHQYERHLENVEKHILDTGHFALETHGDLIASEIDAFLERELDQ